MQSIATRVAQSALACPIVFVAHMQFPVYNLCGANAFTKVRDYLSPYNCQTILMPHPIAHQSNIEQRASSLYTRIERVFYIILKIVRFVISINQEFIF